MFGRKAGKGGGTGEQNEGGQSQSGQDIVEFGTVTIEGREQVQNSDEGIDIDPFQDSELGNTEAGNPEKIDQAKKEDSTMVDELIVDNTQEPVIDVDDIVIPGRPGFTEPRPDYGAIEGAQVIRDGKGQVSAIIPFGRGRMTVDLDEQAAVIYMVNDVAKMIADETKKHKP